MSEEQNGNIPEDVRARLGDVSKYHNPVKGSGKPVNESDETEKVVPVVESKVLVRPRGWLSKVRYFFQMEDTRTIRGYIFYDVAVPALRDLMFNMIHLGAERAIYRDDPPRLSSRSRDRGVPYEKMHGSYETRRSTEPASRYELSKRGRRTHDFGEIIIDTRPEAEEVLRSLHRLIEKYDIATVADLYGMLDLDATFVDSRFGWTELDNARVSRAHGGGYTLILPPTEEID